MVIHLSQTVQFFFYKAHSSAHYDKLFGHYVDYVIRLHVRKHDLVRRCDDGTCVEVSARCDGRAQCPDGSDERACPRGACALLGDAALRCAAHDACYAPDQRCDGVAHCADGSDEADCERGTPCY